MEGRVQQRILPDRALKHLCVEAVTNTAGPCPGLTEIRGNKAGNAKHDLYPNLCKKPVWKEVEQGGLTPFPKQDTQHLAMYTGCDIREREVARG